MAERAPSMSATDVKAQVEAAFEASDQAMREVSPEPDVFKDLVKSAYSLIAQSSGKDAVGAGRTVIELDLTLRLNSEGLPAPSLRLSGTVALSLPAGGEGPQQ